MTTLIANLAAAKAHAGMMAANGTQAAWHAALADVKAIELAITVAQASARIQRHRACFSGLVSNNAAN